MASPAYGSAEHTDVDRPDLCGAEKVPSPKVRAFVGNNGLKRLAPFCGHLQINVFAEKDGFRIRFAQKKDAEEEPNE